MNTRTSIPHWLDLAKLPAVDTDNDWWRRYIACGDEPLATFTPPEKGAGQPRDYIPAARVCGRCSMRLPCLAYWLATTPSDIDRNSGTYVGGTSPRQRVLIRRRLKAVKAC